MCIFAVGYNTSAISQLVPLLKPSILDVNLPSITIPNLRKPISLTRSVTNVGHPVNSIYKSHASRPETLIFKSSVQTNHTSLILIDDNSK